MKTITYKAIPVTERLPKIYNENYLTISEKGFENSRFFNGKRFESAHYEGEITHWLEKTKVNSLPISQEEIEKLITDSDIENSIKNIRTESNELHKYSKKEQDLSIAGLIAGAKWMRQEMSYKCAELNIEKKYTKEDIQRAIEHGRGQILEGIGIGEIHEQTDKFIESLKPNTNGKKDI